ncbi:MAG: hypothetical protein U0527_02285 [Candidatus Eisenbacteria bacterium]
MTGLTEARALARHGVAVVGVDRALRRYTSHSSAWTAVVTTPAFQSADLVPELLDLARSLPQPPLLFISTDEQVKLVSKQQTALREAYRFHFPPSDSVDLLMSKTAFTERAEREGWPIPRTARVASRVELASLSLRFPVIIKPGVRHLATRRGIAQKAFRADDRAALERAYLEIAAFEPEVVVQEWIPGRDADVYFSFHYFDESMRELGAFVGRKLRQWAPEVGSTSLAEPAHEPHLADTARRILQSVASSGFCSVEYKRDARDGRFLITEPTVGRVNLQVGLAIANGVDLVSRAYFALAGLPAVIERPPARPRRWIWFGNDWKSARHYMRQGQLGLPGYLGSLRGPKVHAVWHPRDFRLIRRAMAEACTRLPRALARRLGLSRRGGR